MRLAGIAGTRILWGKWEKRRAKTRKMRANGKTLGEIQESCGYQSVSSAHYANRNPKPYANWTVIIFWPLFAVPPDAHVYRRFRETAIWQGFQSFTLASGVRLCRVALVKPKPIEISAHHS
jgi:hypothetical protein